MSRKKYKWTEHQLPSGKRFKYPTQRGRDYIFCDHFCNAGCPHCLREFYEWLWWRSWNNPIYAAALQGGGVVAVLD